MRSLGMCLQRGLWDISLIFALFCFPMKKETDVLNRVPDDNPLMKHAKLWQHLVVSKAIKVTFSLLKILFIYCGYLC